jgi:ribonuclease inhibitor
MMEEEFRVEIIEINLSGVVTAKDLHCVLSQALDFPDFYGQNWNAFWDAITGLVEMPRVLRFHGWEAFSDRLPREAQMMRQCLADMQREYPEWAAQVEYV